MDRRKVSHADAIRICLIVMRGRSIAYTAVDNRLSYDMTLRIVRGKGPYEPAYVEAQRIIMKERVDKMSKGKDAK